MELKEINKKIEKHFENNNIQRVLLIKYGEIALRGKNRRLFENKLITNIRKNISDLDGEYYVEKEQGRFVLINLDGDIDYDIIIPRIEPILGIVGLSKCIKTKDQSIENLQKVSLMLFKEDYEQGTFKVSTKRSNKKYPLLSNEISQKIGGYIYDNMQDLVCDVHNPDNTIKVELRNDAYIYTSDIKTFGGLPSGTAGKGVVLLSGGFDSPVAGFRMAKRGVDLTCVYFDSPPYTSARAKQKVIDIANRLNDFTGSIKLYIIPFTDIQLHLYENVPPEKMTILMKHTMIRIATQIAETEQAQGLIMGDSVGQVASQTMESIQAVESATYLPLYRPLCGMDKQEIIDLAKKIGTAEISARPYEDCCTIFVAPHPETKPKRHIIESIATKVKDDIDPMIVKAINTANIITF